MHRVSGAWPVNTDKMRFNTYIYIFLQQSLSRYCNTKMSYLSDFKRTKRKAHLIGKYWEDVNILQYPSDFQSDFVSAFPLKNKFCIYSILAFCRLLLNCY